MMWNAEAPIPIRPGSDLEAMRKHAIITLLANAVYAGVLTTTSARPQQITIQERVSDVALFPGERIIRITIDHL